jgi:decaprenylphospho-beta-D-ribofuranose 2-oxidase
MGETARVSGWGGATSSHSTVIRPIDDPQWHDLLAKVGPRGVIARGGGCGYGDAAQNGGGVVALTAPDGELHEVVVEDGAVVADAGTSLGALVQALAPLGLTLPVVPGTGRVTVGGAIAADVHGKNHVRHGTFGANVRELCVLTPGLGPLTVSPVEHPEVFWATVGGLGLTGVIRHARLALVPLDSGLMRTRDTIAADLPGLLSALRSAAATHPYAVGWADAVRGGGLVTTAEPVLPRRGGGVRTTERRPHLPALPGHGLGWPPLTAVANRARKLAAWSRPRRQEPLPAVLFPLDGVPDWPALHGRRGLVQYQFTVPFGAEDVLAAALTGTRRAGRPATLAALKVFGAANPAALSFPQPGWSLALDFPADPALAPVLDGLDERVAAAGGRVYLVKDSRLRPDVLGAMYPDLARWRAERAVLDPDGVMVSDLARRLGLTGDFHG